MSRHAVPVLGEVLQERHDQDAKWGEQNHPNGTGGFEWERGYTRVTWADLAREHCKRVALDGSITWADIFEEEAAEVLAESDEERLRAELVQVAAVAVAWVEAIDRRRAVVVLCPECGRDLHGYRGPRCRYCDGTAE